jgi:hypothetical protein
MQIKSGSLGNASEFQPSQCRSYGEHAIVPPDLVAICGAGTTPRLLGNNKQRVVGVCNYILKSVAKTLLQQHMESIRIWCTIDPP